MLLIRRWRKRRRSVPGIGNALLYQRCDDRISGVQSDRVLHMLLPPFGVAASAPTSPAIYEGVRAGSSARLPPHRRPWLLIRLPVMRRSPRKRLVDDLSGHH